MSLKIKNVPEEVTLDDGRVVKVKSLSAFMHGEVIAEMDDGRPRGQLSDLALDNMVARVSLVVDETVSGERHRRFGQYASTEFMESLTRNDIRKIAQVSVDRFALEQARPNSSPTPSGSTE